MEKPNLPKGTRDFGPAVMARRQLIFSTIQAVFRQFGFMPLETPAMENLSVLMGKYGEEGDQLLFRILNSGDYLKNVDSIQYLDSKQLTGRIAEKGLRYDLTVPFARYVVMNRHEIALPFKRYQMQPVWRADRPQKGRYREFYQCDADVVGTYSLVCEMEIITMIKQVFSTLGISDYSIRINHRGILTGLAETLGARGKETDLFTAIDKLDKIGEQGVREELNTRGIAAADRLFEILGVKGTNEEKLKLLTDTFTASEAGRKGVDDITQVMQLLAAYGDATEHLELDIALARGLSYYTGTIFEVKINNVAIGSVSGGGRYDNLTQAFGSKEPLPGIGISFGVDRIYDAMEELRLFPPDAGQTTQILVCPFDDQALLFSLSILKELRGAGISSEMYPDTVKFKKQLEFANRKSIPFVVIIGPEEMQTGNLMLKELATGEQTKSTLAQIIQRLTK
jgi:histidyl-tRNA synthetase